MVTHPHGQCCCLGFPAHPLPAHGGAEQKGWEHGARAACSTTTHPNTACSSAGRETRQGSGLAGHQGSVSASAWQHQAPGDVSTQPPGLRPAVGCCHPPLQPGHLHPGLLQARPWEKDTEAGITARTPTVPSARLGVLSTLGAPAGHHRDLSSTREAASVTCPSPFYPLGS